MVWPVHTRCFRRACPNSKVNLADTAVGGGGQETLQTFWGNFWLTVKFKGLQTRQLGRSGCSCLTFSIRQGWGRQEAGPDPAGVRPGEGKGRLPPCLES